jgi:DNA-binding transcriptional LysR family regulator
MDRLQSMRSFARVVDAGSFAAVAREMNVSPAAVTRLVADLEDHLGARLLNRTTRHVSLTEIGELYLERVRQILIEVDEAEALASTASAEPRGHVRVLCSAAFATHQLAKHLPRFREAYPQVTLELAAPGPVETVDEAYDLTLISLARKPQLEGSFVARRLARSEVIVCASPAYLKRRGRPTHPRELPQHDAMVPTQAREARFQRCQPGAGASSETVVLPLERAALNTVHVDTMYAAAIAGLGIAALPSYVADTALQAGALERVLPEWRLLTATLYAAWPSRKHVPARTRALVDFLVDTFGGEDIDPWLPAMSKRRKKN